MSENGGIPPNIVSSIEKNGDESLDLVCTPLSNKPICNIMYHGQNVVNGIRFMVIRPIMEIRITRILNLKMI